MNISKEARKIILKAQKSEITEHYIYLKLAKRVKDENNKQVLIRIANEEKNHYEIWKEYTNIEIKPNHFKIIFFYLIARILGLTFGIKLMEKREEIGKTGYRQLAKEVPEALQIANEEDEHEQTLINMLQEDLLNYVGSIVLGLNDALVELTGTLAGLTFALQNTRLIATAGLITGIAASFSMAASEYLSNKADENENALRASIYTGFAYITTVIALILPYLLFNNLYLCLGATLTIAIAIIFFFNFYISVAKDLNFGKRFLEMGALSLSVAAISFGIAVVIRQVWGIDI
ncbi:VIT1/CCC1 transporter family protein [Spirochaeta cellobiosiphila]|uniref:VIT1/CCC1 transporter family protein n=1 Tax=Spirochaeta cellobiosiphila TaxID=504483 RepID=UPI00041D9AFB|nr:VIT1/CCC1 transporter family protein [Spirochaeta cellobiosiphila]